MNETNTEKKEISFHFQPNDYDNGGHVIEKEDSTGKKRRYLAGISSGLNVDSHGERMTQKCIDSFIKQANSQDILLYPDIHGIKSSEDIGLLTKMEILSNGDWYTEYRLYDDHDQVDTMSVDRANKLWKQLKGLPPYSKPKQKGFSIEGIIPEHAIKLNKNGEVDTSIIDDILLDGVIVVPRPAYKDSVITAIYKALGQTTPERENSIRETLAERIKQKDIGEEYYKQKYEYQDALESMLELIMGKKNNNKEQELKVLFDEYSILMVELLLRSKGAFQIEEETNETGDEDPVYAAKATHNTKLVLYKALLEEIKTLKSLMEKRK